MAGIELGNLDEPDDEVGYGDEGSAAKVSLGFPGFGIGNESTVWRSTLAPGWSWKRNIQPNVPFESCPAHHREYVVAGTIRYVMDDGTTVDAGPGSHLLINPGHQAEVVGDEVCVLLDW